jgi:SAM-dependent methyltransferase
MAVKIAAPAPDKADYGIDAPVQQRRLILRGALLILLGAGLFVMNRTDAPGPGLSLLFVLGFAGLGFLAAAGVMYWSSRTGKLQLRDRILDAIPWRGDEKVLDVGCGLGLFLIGAAKRLKTGKATGIDLWRTEDLSGNSATNAMANAKAEGVASYVRVEEGDMRKLSYQPNSFDIVLSSLAIHNLKDADDRDKSVLEMLRVLRTGGHLAILDILHTNDYIKIVEANGAEIVQKSPLSFLWCLPTRWFIARKR